MPTNSEIIRSSYAAFARGDVDAAMTLFAPDIEWTHPDGMNDYGLGGTKKGPDEVRAFMKRARTVFSELRPTPHEFVEDGDRVMVIGEHHMRVAHSGQVRKVRFVHSWRLAGGKATHFEDYHDTAGVRALLGSSQAGMSSWDEILGVGLGFWSAKVLLVAVELGVFTELAAQPLDGETLRVKLGLHERAARDFFDALVALRLLDRDEGLYRNTPATAAALDESDHERYLGGLLEVADRKWYRSWGNLKTALQTGLPQNNVEDGRHDPFDVLYAEPELMRKFQRAMTGGAMGSILALAESFPWEKHTSVADIGCSEGALLARVLRRHPHLDGVGLDLPPVAATFDETVARFRLADRMRFVPGSFFTDPLPEADVIVFGHVLHDWDLDTKRMLLDKAYAALPTGGAVVVFESLIDDDRRHNAFGLLMSLHMLLESPGGFDYTAADCIGWLSDAGFTDCHVQHLWGPESMVVATK